MNQLLLEKPTVSDYQLQLHDFISVYFYENGL